jgi:4-hydroxy-4-methyl-2-oxoglutarate aldolase
MVSAGPCTRNAGTAVNGTPWAFAKAGRAFTERKDLDAGCRDVADLTAMGFPVWSRYICTFGTVEETLGDVDVGLVCAGQRVRPGDMVVGGDDGVVVVARAMAAEVLDAALARQKKETANRERYARGELGLDVNRMRERLASTGLTYLDEEPEQQ